MRSDVRWIVRAQMQAETRCEMYKYTHIRTHTQGRVVHMYRLTTGRTLYELRATAELREPRQLLHDGVFVAVQRCYGDRRTIDNRRSTKTEGRPINQIFTINNRPSRCLHPVRGPLPFRPL
jgi:hypothetical protein